MRRILILGADRVMPKLFYFSEEFRKHDIAYQVYTHDGTPEARRYTSEYGAEMLDAPPHKRSVLTAIRNLYRVFCVTKRKDVLLAELFSDYHILISLGYFIIMRLKRIPVVLWCRGELYAWNSFSWWERLYFHIVIPNARLVMLKETYMRKTLETAGVKINNNLIELHNTVPLPPYSEKTFAKEKLALLFLNMFKPWRNVTFCVEIAAQLKRAGFDFSMKIVGEKGVQDGSLVLANEAQKLRAAIKSYELEAYVTVHPFSDNPLEYYREADFFLLPSDDLIYCNYALLESMSHGVIPIVYHLDRHCHKIIQNGVTGYALPLKPEQWAQTIIALSNNPSMARAVSRNARRKIEQEFSTAMAFETYWSAINSVGINDPAFRRTSARTIICE